MIYKSCRSITLGRDFFFEPGRSAVELCDSRGQSTSCGRLFGYVGVAPEWPVENTSASNISDYASSTGRFLRHARSACTRTRWQDGDEAEVFDLGPQDQFTPVFCPTELRCPQTVPVPGIPVKIVPF